MLQAQRRVLVALVALVALAVGALAADKEVSKPLDLNTVKAHDEQKDTSIPQFAAQEALQQLNASITACYLQLGPKAEIDGVGGCGCTRGFVVSGNRSEEFESGASRPMVPPKKSCVEESKKTGAGKKGFLSRLFKKKTFHVDVPDLPPCSSTSDCLDTLHAHHASFAQKSAACEAKERAIGFLVTSINETLAQDLLKRQAKSQEIHEWILLMRSHNKLMVRHTCILLLISHNKLMVGQLKRYNELDSENKRLSRDMQNMQRDRQGLQSKLSQLQEQKIQLQEELEKVRKAGDIDWSDCHEKMRKLRDGLASRGLEIPKLE